MAVYLRTLLGILIIRMMEKMGTTLPRLEILSYLAIVCMWECPGNNIGVGSFISGPVWLLQRSTLMINN